MTNEDKIEDFEVYSIGLCFSSVCTSLTPAEAEVRMNAEQPTGISSPWKISPRKTFASGHPNPCDCRERPGHKHYLFEC